MFLLISNEFCVVIFAAGLPCINLVDSRKVEAAALAAVAGTMGAIILILVVVVVLLVLVIMKKLKCVSCHNKGWYLFCRVSRVFTKFVITTNTYLLL